MISGFCHDINEICALLGFYKAQSGNPVPTFQDNLLVPLSSGKRLVSNYQSTLHKNPEERRFHKFESFGISYQTLSFYMNCCYWILPIQHMVHSCQAAPVNNRTWCGPPTEIKTFQRPLTTSKFWSPKIGKHITWRDGKAGYILGFGQTRK